MPPIPFPITKILLPYDGSPAARNALELAARLSRAGQDAVTGLTLLQVIGGGYVARHVHNVDLRVARLEHDKDWQRIRTHYLEHEVLPVLEEGKQFLLSLGVRAPIEVHIAEGKVSEEIIRFAKQGAFSTIMMGRRGLSPLKALFLGSVTRGVLSLAQNLTVYVAAQEVRPAEDCPVSPLLLPVDGSASSLAAVRQAATLAQAFRPAGPRLTLLHVIDTALLGVELQHGTPDLVEEGERILAGARGILEEADLAGCWEEKLLLGEPAPTIAQVAHEGGHRLIMMGSRGLSRFASLILGSVTSSVVHMVSRAAVAVVYV